MKDFSKSNKIVETHIGGPNELGVLEIMKVKVTARAPTVMWMEDQRQKEVRHSFSCGCCTG